jgi:hypothetical protein
MSLQTWQETLVSANVAGTLLNTFTTAKTVLPTACLVTLPANYFYVGRTLRITVYGAISNIVTTPGTLTMQVNLGTVAAFSTGALQLSSTAHTTVPFKLEALVTCRSVGATTTATLIGQSVVTSQAIVATAVADGTQTHSALMGPNTAPAAGTGFDSTAAQTLDFFAGFSISNAGNGIQIQQYVVEALN